MTGMDRLERVREYQITLDRYQLDNLRWVLRLTGYNHPHDRVGPFHMLDTGDWLGELYWKLHEVAPDEENDDPNSDVDWMRGNVLSWVTNSFRRTFDGRLTRI